MRTSTAFALVFWLATSHMAWAHEANPALPPVPSLQPAASAIEVAGQDRRLVEAGFREALRVQPRAKRDSRAPDPSVRESKNWFSRHPVLLGTLVGAGTGAATSGLMENELFCSGGDEDCLFHGGGRVLIGAGLGAGIGALVGWLGSL